MTCPEQVARDPQTLWALQAAEPELSRPLGVGLRLAHQWQKVWAGCGVQAGARARASAGWKGYRGGSMGGPYLLGTPRAMPVPQSEQQAGLQSQASTELGPTSQPNCGTEHQQDGGWGPRGPLWEDQGPGWQGQGSQRAGRG